MNLNRNFISYSTIVRKEMIRTLRIWAQTIVPPAITMTLYFIIFGKLIGGQIKHIQGFTYMQYIVPGLVMMTILSHAFLATSGGFYGAKFQRYIDELLISPSSNHTILLGYMSAGVFRALVVSSLVSVIALLFTHMRLHHPVYMVFFAFSAACLLSLAGLINGILAESFDNISWIPSFVIVPFSYLGGVFYPRHLLPVFWQKVLLLNPMFYFIDAFRYSVLGIHEIFLGYTTLVMWTLIIAAYALAYYLLNNSNALRS